MSYSNYILENKVANLEQRVSELEKLIDEQAVLIKKLAWALAEVEMPIEMWAPRFNK